MNKKQVQQFLKKRNLHPIKKLGQNFLINKQAVQKIVTRVQKYSPPFVEIGPGLGALTNHFKKKKDIILVERDKKIAAYWKKQAYSVLSADALKLEWLTAFPKKFILFGNLPYEIASSLIVKSCLHQNQIKGMIFMMQKEVAQRAIAWPHNKSYGLLSVIAQTFWEIYPVAPIPKTCFYPVPKVDGTVLEFRIKQKASDLDSKSFLQFVKQCFAFKRKMLYKQIKTGSAEQIKKILGNLKLSENCRAEELSSQQFVKLYLQINRPS